MREYDAKASHELFKPPAGFGLRQWSLRNRRFGTVRAGNVANPKPKR